MTSRTARPAAAAALPPPNVEKNGPVRATNCSTISDRVMIAPMG
jgi:hypothetical protein